MASQNKKILDLNLLDISLEHNKSLPAFQRIFFEMFLAIKTLAWTESGFNKKA
jgi:hypothetical protein